MYNCLPMYHSVGGVVAIGAMLVNGGSVLIAGKILGQPVLGRRRRARLHRRSSISANSAAISSPRRRIRARRDHKLRLALRQRAARRRLAAPSASASAVRQCSNSTPPPKAMSGSTTSGQARRDRPRAALLAHRFRSRSCAATPTPATPLRGADGLCSRCAPGETGEALGQDRRAAPRTALRGLQRRSEADEEDPARRVRARRRLDAHRRPDAPRRRGLLSISSTASATRSAGRARMSRRWKSSAACRRACGRRRRDRLSASKFPAPRAAPAWRCSRLPARSIFPPSRARSRSCRATPDLCSSAHARNRDHRDPQAQARRLSRRRLRSRANRRPALCLRRRGQRLCRARR